MTTRITLLAATAIVATSLAAGCAASDSETDLTSAVRAGGADGEDLSLSPGDAGKGEAPACVQQQAQATISYRPVDIVFVIDNSGSMGGEIADVEKQINDNFATVLSNANPPIDYRVVMLSKFGTPTHLSKRICVAKPLGGIESDNAGHCKAVPSQPVNTARFFHHSPTNESTQYGIGSFNPLCQLLEQFSLADEFNLQPGGYQSALRPAAFKFFVVVTDDHVKCEFDGVSYDDLNTAAGGEAVAESWDSALLALSTEQFGTAAARNYAFHSIVSLAPFQATGPDDYGLPHPPDAIAAPIREDVCASGARNAGTGYQALSIKTEGYRFPTCGLDYTQMFQEMTHGVIEGATLPCTFAVPDAPAGATLDLDTVVMSYSSDGKSRQNFTQVARPDDCTKQGYYLEDDRLKLCPDTCASVQADPKAAIEIRYGCEVDAAGNVK